MPQTSEAAIVLDDLHLTLGSDAGPVNILNGLSLAIEAGERVGLVGPSGSGKTSLLMVVAGLERATSGRVRVTGEDITRLSEDRLAALRGERIGIVFQNFHLVPSMTALENVMLPLEFRGGGDDIHTRAARELEAVGLGHRLDHYPGQLSGGEQQRVALARAFVVRPQLLLADEPTGNLDQGTGEVIMDLLFDLAEKSGTTLLLITHAPELAARCSRLIALQDGRIDSDNKTDAERMRA
ncbi:MAG: ABC transporter ATP-binding protein [Rhodospirillales bacterium]